jgi:Fuc2NAc and GlcNAc transferase
LSLLVAAVGLYDDIRGLSVRIRFIAQLLACIGLLITLSPPPVLGLPGGFVLSGLPLLFILCAFGVWWVNLFNFMDGIDGIAGGQGFFMLLFGAAAGLLAGPASLDQPLWWWLAGLAAATLGFLLHNWPPARIFMGDVGSTYLAFMILALALLSVGAGWMTYAAWLIIGAGFVADATVTLLRRMLAGERWYEAHRSHAYQILARRWRSHRAVSLLLLAVNAMWLAPLAWLSIQWPSWAWFFVLAAYGPLVAGAIFVGAGGVDKGYT